MSREMAILEIFKAGLLDYKRLNIAIAAWLETRQRNCCTIGNKAHERRLRTKSKYLLPLVFVPWAVYVLCACSTDDRGAHGVATTTKGRSSGGSTSSDDPNDQPEPSADRIHRDRSRY